MNIPVSAGHDEERSVRVHQVDRAPLTGREKRSLRAFRVSAFAELALRVAPKSTSDRLHFIRRIERIASRIIPDRMYSVAEMCRPLDRSFCPKETEAPRVDGAAVLDDLNRLAEFVTLYAPIPLSAADDNVREISQLAADMFVSRKSIMRWRSRGLVGYRVAAADGPGRLAFNPYTVDRLCRRFPKLTNKQRQQTRVDDEERDCIIRLAQAYIAEQPLTLYQISQRLAGRMGRAVETVYTVLRNHVASQPDDVLAQDPNAGLEWNHELVFDQDGGSSADDSSSGSARELSADAARTLLEIEVRRLQRGRVQLIDHESFHRDDADAIILATALTPPAVTAVEEAPASDDPDRVPLPAVPLMSAEEERDAFRRYNYLKHKAVARARSIRAETASSDELEEVADLMREARSVRDAIVQANLRLVIHVAKPFARRTVNFFELISEGNVALLRAVECFDFGRGFKFSTYLTHALRRSFSKAVAKESAHLARYHTNLDEHCEDRVERVEEEAEDGVPDSVRRVLAAGLRRLTSRERFVIRRRFGFTRTREVWTLSDIAAELGVSKERVRQLQVLALEKLSESIDPRVMQLLRTAA